MCFLHLLKFGPLHRPRGLKTAFRCLYHLSWEKLVQNNMSHAMLIPKINNFTAFENIVLKFDRAKRIFAVFRVSFAIFIYGKCWDMIFQIPLTILHPLICDKPMFSPIGQVLGVLLYFQNGYRQPCWKWLILGTFPSQLRGSWEIIFFSTISSI